PYPWQLKQRVGGRLGHLSNDEAAALVEYTAAENCRVVVLAHLSEHNNRPDLAKRVVSRALARSGRNDVSVRVAATRGPTPPIVLESFT
ncbi:MAG: MBL fold metallo-hydrolase, partial [Acidobacteriota bacterium]|nr:MBL fold metallo-hydrolase [Acidobacteriota bacterium]